MISLPKSNDEASNFRDIKMQEKCISGQRNIAFIDPPNLHNIRATFVHFIVLKAVMNLPRALLKVNPSIQFAISPGSMSV